MLEERLNLDDASEDLIERAKLLDFYSSSGFSIIEDRPKFPHLHRAR